MQFTVGDDTAEFACVLKSLIEYYNSNNKEQITQDDIAIFSYIDALEDDVYSPYLKISKRIPIRMPVPEMYAPIEGKPYIPCELLPTPGLTSESTSRARAEGVGLFEYSFKEPYLYKNEKTPRVITYWRWIGQREYYPLGTWLYFTLKKDVFRFRKAIGRVRKKSNDVCMPVLPDGVLNKVYDNTIGFLKKGHENKDQYKKYNIAYKRGLLLAGAPGTGKTMTCKWLRELCIKENLAHKVVTLDAYQKAVGKGTVKQLFELPDKKRGIIFFDDMDEAVRSRESGNNHVSYFLTALDGIDSTEGIVFVFTTNHMKDLDSAFVRPGRIDIFLPFKRPNKRLRRKFIEQTFDADIKNLIDIDDFAERTDDHSFAEIEEVRKMITLDFMSNIPIDVNKTFKEFQKCRKDFEERAKLGFKLDDDSDNDDGWGY